MMSTTVIRFKYYHAWLLADAICNNSGLGFNGYDKDGVAKWDMISNINVIGFEVSFRQTVAFVYKKFLTETTEHERTIIITHFISDIDYSWVQISVTV